MPEQDNFEAKMARLAEIVRLLESDGITLEQGLDLYKEGVACSRFCRDKLKEAKLTIETWQKEADDISVSIDDLDEYSLDISSNKTIKDVNTNSGYGNTRFDDDVPF